MGLFSHWSGYSVFLSRCATIYIKIIIGVIDMYNILIVDDEYEIRQGLSACNWESIGIHVIGSCEHGLEAFQKILDEPVDILLTDIRMPFMDGLELIKNVNQRFSYIKTVILTGYNDFSYAQQGIQFGVSDYLLKPVSDMDIKRTFAKLVDKLNEEQLIETRIRSLERKAKLTSKLLRARFLQKLLFQSLSQDEIEEGCSEGEMILEGNRYEVSIIRIDRKEDQVDFYSYREWNLILFALDNILTEIWDNKVPGFHWIDPQTGRCYLLLADSDNRASPSSTNSLIEQIAVSLQRIGGLLLSTLSWGCGPLVDRAAQVYLSCLSVSHALNANRNKQFIAQDINLVSISEIEPALTKKPALEVIVKEGSSQSIIDEAKRFIDRNFERSIVLANVAEHIHINPNYLSSLFKKVTGQNYMHYLTLCRVNHAIKLLVESPIKVYEISEMVGYSSPSYFSDIFRKQTGQTPYEYRLMHGNGGEDET